MSIFKQISNKIKALRNSIYLQAEKDDFQENFARKEKAGNFRIYSPELFDSSNSTINAYSYIAQGTIVTDCEIGKFTSIGPNCTIGYGQHPTKWPSTSPAFTSSVKIFDKLYADKSYFAPEREKIVIGNDVWIGAHVYIKNGITIGNGAVVAAGSVVVKNVEPYSIVGGVPAKVIKMRFSEEIINELQQLKWWDKDVELLKKLQPAFVSEDIKAFINAVKKNEI